MNLHVKKCSPTQDWNPNVRYSAFQDNAQKLSGSPEPLSIRSPITKPSAAGSIPASESIFSFTDIYLINNFVYMCT